MNRKCDGCTICCTTQRVPEFDKPEYTPCQHCKLNQGCTIYNDRPKSCQKFECAWLQGELPEWMKPDKIHMMVEKIDGFDFVLALHEPGHENWPTFEIEEALKKEYVEKGIAVVTSDRKAILPEGWTVERCRKEVTEAAKTMGVIK